MPNFPEQFNTSSKNNNPEKRTSAILKIAGATSEAEDLSIKEHFRRIFEEQPIKNQVFIDGWFSIKTVAKIEKQKTPEEKQIIEQINGFMQEFVTQYGGQPLDIREEKIYFIDRQKASNELLNKIGFQDSNDTAFYERGQQAVLINPSVKELLHKTQAIVHEMLHFNSFQSETQKKDSRSKESTHWRRCGVEVYDKKENSILFRSLNEAITEELAKRFDEKYFGKMKSLKGSLERRERVRSNLSAKNEKELGFAKEDISRVDENGNVFPCSYKLYRQRLKEDLRIIMKSHPGQFQSEEDVFKEFAKAYFTGNILMIARLLERAYTIKNAFKRIGQDKYYEKFKKSNEKK